MRQNNKQDSGLQPRKFSNKKQMVANPTANLSGFDRLFNHNDKNIKGCVELGPKIQRGN